ncbi:MAG: UMP kinase [Mycoplasmataceae bacterium]|nr:UMP kinase [Mycoplasmataceae bacterium]
MKRILIKLSGEGLANKERNLDIDPEVVNDIGRQVKEISERGIQVGIVVGGGNFWRGASAEQNGIPRNRADYIGMLATIMNGLAIQSGFEKLGMKTRIQSALIMDAKIAENYVNETAIAALEKGEVVVFAGGTGRPFFTTDTAATLVASEINADSIIMGKNGVDGIYSSDPKTNKDAEWFETITWNQILEKNLNVMDSTAASMANDNDINLIVFNIKEENSIIRAVDGDIKHTKVTK